MRTARTIALAAELIATAAVAAQDSQTTPGARPGQQRDAMGQPQRDRTLAEKRQHEERKGAMSQAQRDQLEPLAGRWRVKFEMHGEGQGGMGAGGGAGQQAAFEGFSERSWVLGDSFLQETFSSEGAMTGAGQAGRSAALGGGRGEEGLPGVAFYGYDPEKGQYKVAWLDARSGSIALVPGDYDTATRTFTFTPKDHDKADKAQARGGEQGGGQEGQGQGADQQGRPGAMAAKHHGGKKVTVRLVSDDEHIVEMHDLAKAGGAQGPDAQRPGADRGALAHGGDAGLIYRVTYTRVDRTSDRGTTGGVGEREIRERGMEKDKKDKGDK